MSDTHGPAAPVCCGRRHAVAVPAPHRASLFRPGRGTSSGKLWTGAGACVKSGSISHMTINSRIHASMKGKISVSTLM